MLLDAGSGNSALRNGAELGVRVEGFENILLSHHHPDHMAGLLFVQFQRTLVTHEESPVRVYSTDEALEGLKSLCLATRLNISTIDNQSGRTREGLGCCAGNPPKSALRWILGSGLPRLSS
jgi:metal-dependent hydrolase (beta-lactamase superfamily II)